MPGPREQTPNQEPIAPRALTPRGVALTGLANVLRRHLSLEDAFVPGEMEERDRAFARLLLTTTLRRLGQADALVRSCLERDLPSNAPHVFDLLRLGAVQLAFLDVPAHAVVSTAVDTVKDSSFAFLGPLVNAVLRRLAREGKERAASQDAARLNTPDWLWDSWTAAYGAESCRKIAEAHLAEPPLDLTLKDEIGDWPARLGAEILPTGSLRCVPGGALTKRPGFHDGAWWVQDAAAALPARLLGNVAGKRVVDLCAAPGGKCAQLAAGGAIVTAVDRSAARLQRLRVNLDRLHLKADIVTVDATKWKLADPVDAVLLDAPCSATGTLRRNPDIAWHRNQTDVAKLVDLQYRLLTSALDMLTPGGTLVYATCSLQPEEGERQIEALLQSGAPVRLMPVGEDELGLEGLVTPQGYLRSFPFHLADKGGMDAFFAARLQKI